MRDSNKEKETGIEPLQKKKFQSKENLNLPEKQKNKSKLKTFQKGKKGRRISNLPADSISATIML